MRTTTRTRHRSGRDTNRTGRDRGKPSHLDRLLAQRDRLADWLHEAQGHGYRNAADAAALLDATETAIRNLSPTSYKVHSNRWAEEDAAREHDPGDPRPQTCPTCALHIEAGAGQHR